MGYTALYRKWRPTTFDEVRGQDHIVTTLKNQIRSDRIGHAYLFCGTRGTGKTSVAKIFAKAVNCAHPVDGNPCGECPSCRAIAAGASMNVVEIDAASNNGVDNVRQIREEVEYAPADARFRVYIIDEAHMLTPNACNALLKTLEEPPSYVIFILATTDPNRLINTVLSRCQRYDIHQIDTDTIAGRHREMTDPEGSEADEDALHYVAKKGDGSLRDAISLLDQCAAFYYGKRLSYDRVLDVLGAVDNEVFSAFLRLLRDGNAGACLREVEKLLLEGRELGQFVTDFVWYLRNVLLALTGEADAELLDMSGSDRERLLEDASLFTENTVMRYIRVLSEALNQMKYSANRRVILEVALIKLTRPVMEENLDSVLERLSDLERRVADGSAFAAAAERAQSLPAPGAAAPAPVQETPAFAQAVPEETYSPAQGAPAEPTVVLPRARAEELRALTQDWKTIIRSVGGSAVACLSNAELEPAGEGRMDVIFREEGAYDVGSRPQLLGEVEEEITKRTGRQVQLVPKLVNGADHPRKNYISDEELKAKFNMEVIFE